jgi:pimeloyl-ACP methyl ester carboxylesterase
LSTRATHVNEFEHGGAKLVDEVLGAPAAPHVVFMHGWGSSRESLRGVGVLFEHTHRVHLLDLPGFGAAPLPPDDWDTARYADLVERYILERLPGVVVLVGHSFGGRIAVRLAARRLPQIRRVVLMAAPGLPVPGSSWRRLKRRGIRGLRAILTAVRPVTGPAAVDWHTRTFGSKDYLAAGALRPVLVRVVNEDLTESVRAIDCPVLLLWGADDREASPAVGSEYARILGQRATLHLLPHKDHHLYTGTGAHLCAFKIRSWLAADAGS